MYLTHDSNRMVDSAADHHHRTRALDKGSLHVPHHRHLLGRDALCRRELPAGNPHDVPGDGGQGRRQRQHPRLSRDPRHPRRRHHALRSDERLRRMGNADDQRQAQRISRDRAARHCYLHRRLLQLPHSRHGHAPGHGQVPDRAHEACLHHRRDCRTDLHHRAGLQLGGCRRFLTS